MESYLYILLIWGFLSQPSFKFGSSDQNTGSVPVAVFPVARIQRHTALFSSDPRETASRLHTEPRPFFLQAPVAPQWEETKYLKP